jgi:hypothetical protein
VYLVNCHRNSRFGNSLAGIGGTVARAGPGAEGASAVGGTLTADVLAPALVIGGLLVVGEVWLQTNGTENEPGNPWSSFRGGSGTEMGPYGPTIVNSDPMENSAAPALPTSSSASSASAPLPPDPEFDPNDFDPFDGKKFGKFSANDLSKSGQKLDPADKGGNLTKAGRALDKHGVTSRDTGTFPEARGNPIEKNSLGQQELDKILQNPGSKSRMTPTMRGLRLDIRTPSGQGVRFTTDGEFEGFLDPKK